MGYTNNSREILNAKRESFRKRPSEGFADTLSHFGFTVDFRDSDVNVDTDWLNNNPGMIDKFDIENIKASQVKYLDEVPPEIREAIATADEKELGELLLGLI